MSEEFAWSATRARMFQECRRKFYYRYRVAPMGKRPDAPPEQQEAYRVKDLIGLEAWAGDLVHDVIQQILQRWKAGRTCTVAEAAGLATHLLSSRFRASQHYWNAHPDEFSHRPALLDVHYHHDSQVSRDRAAKLKNVVVSSVQGFLMSPLADRIRECGPRNWLPIDRNAAARLPNGLLILVKPDFAFRDGDWLRILDWKTGRPDPLWEDVQVICYALYGAEKWSHELERIDPRIVHLFPEFRISERNTDPARQREIAVFVAETHEEMVCALRTPGPVEERFPVCEDSRSCKWCPFRRLCPGGKRVLEAETSAAA
jgi:hypothetical protein